MKKNWLFGATKFQGNPKFLFLYLNHEQMNINSFWIADTQEQADYINRLGYKSVVMGSAAATELFAIADVYIVENFRESLPESINPDITIANLWHGVGLKSVEFGVGNDGSLADSILKKYIRNYSMYKNNLLFLAPSDFMRKHFEEDMRLESRQIVRGSYPRNIIASHNQYATFDHCNIDGRALSDFDEIILYAPTYREEKKISLFTLFADIERLKKVLENQNALLIFKMHHFEESGEDYIEFRKQHDSFDRFMFWDDSKDIYEIFNQITTAIVDYSSIYYDLLQAGVKRFIRYVPDFKVYSETRGLKFDYLTYTDGALAYNFDELLLALDEKLGELTHRQFLVDSFFGYSDPKILPAHQMADLVRDIELFKIQKNECKKLYSFDVFDTLICRSTVEPASIFFAVQDKLKRENLGFSEYFIHNYPKIRREIEADIRDSYRKTTFERNNDSIEITFNALFLRLADNFDLNDSQVEFLKHIEIECEMDAVRPLQKRIDFLLGIASKGHDVILISDMYLPKHVVEALVKKADSRLAQFKLYVSSDVGDQKSTGKLFKHIFFDLDYQYSEWLHFGDNQHADGRVPRRFGIQSFVHQMNRFIPYEKALIGNIQSSDGYKVASLINQKRWANLDENNMQFNDVNYYAYAYISGLLVPYVLWAIKDAIIKKYDTLYFISRDGHYLKCIADKIIAKRGYNIKTKYIYGSRKAWRLASQINKIDDEFFLPFGLFTAINSYEELIKATQISEELLLELVPQIKNFQCLDSFRGKVIEEIRSILSSSKAYKEKLLELGKEQRVLVGQYLKENIDFSERFAFVEYWGRGYTQDLLARLLSHVAQENVTTPFYYMRNYTSDMGNSIRHRYTQAPTNFTFVEPIFASTPYTSVTGYQIDNGKIQALYELQENSYSDQIQLGLESFTDDYLNCEFYDEDMIGRLFRDFVVQYHLNNPNDQYILSVYSNFKDNVNSYGNVREIAPAFSLEDIQQSTHKKLLELTNNIEMSLSKSSETVREQYIKVHGKEAGKAKRILSEQRFFPYNELSSYVANIHIPQKILLIKDQTLYSSVEFSEANKLKTPLMADSLVEVIALDWNHAGIPRFLTNQGYISAHRNLSRIVTESIERYSPTSVVDASEKYFLDIAEGKLLVAQTDLIVYSSPIFSKYTVTGKIFTEGHLITPLNIVWNQKGIPVIQTAHGYVSAEVSSVKTYIPYEDLIAKLTKNAFIVLEDVPILASVNGVKTGSKIDKGTLFIKPKFVVNDHRLFIKNAKGFIRIKESYIQISRQDIENYLVFVSEDMKVIAKSDLKIYDTVNFDSQITECILLKKGSVINVARIEWTKKGTPRIQLVSGGYITANLEKIKVIYNDSDTSIVNTAPSVSVQRPIKKISHSKFVLRQPKSIFNRLENGVVVGTIGANVILDSSDLVNSNDEVFVKLSNGYIHIHDTDIQKVREDIETYYISIGENEAVKTLGGVKIYEDINFTQQSIQMPRLKKGKLIKPLSIVWTEKGTPRFKIKEGYITTNKNFVEIVDNTLFNRVVTLIK